jgi:hypothetical protein
MCLYYLIIFLIANFAKILPQKCLPRVLDHPKKTNKSVTLKDRPTRKMRPHSQYQNLLQNIQSATTTFQHKRVQPGTLPILSIFHFFLWRFLIQYGLYILI